MKKILVIIACFMLIAVIASNKNDNYVIPDEAIRLRIVANSNSNYDQLIKMKVRDNLEASLEKTVLQQSSIEEARKNIKNNLKEYEQVVADTLKENNYDKPFKINYGYNYFPEKEYKQVIYEEGMYESLLVTIGEGNGDNWWCVLFPPICNLEVEESETQDVEYRFLIKDIMDKYLIANN